MATFIDYSGGLDILKNALGVSGTSEDAKLRRWSLRASGLINVLARGRRFIPFVQTRYYDHPAVDSVLRLDEDLLEITTLTTQNGSTTISGSDYFLKTGESHNLYPKNIIELKLDGSQNVFIFSGTTQQANAVAGIWGYHDDWDNAWVDTGDTVQDDPLSSSSTTLTVNNIDGTDVYGQTPRISAGMILKIGSEFVYVASLDTGANTATIVRGVNGSTAASHTQGVAVYSYQVPWAVQEAALDIVSLWRTIGGSGYGVVRKRIGDYEVSLGTMRIINVNGMGVPAHVASTIRALRRVGV